MKTAKKLLSLRIAYFLAKISSETKNSLMYEVVYRDY